MQINEVQVVAQHSVPNIANLGTAGEVVPADSQNTVQVITNPQPISNQLSDTTAGDSQTQGREQKSGTDLAELISERRESLAADLRAFFAVHDTGRVVIHVVDDADQLVRQFPADAMIELSEFLGKNVDHLLDEVV